MKNKANSLQNTSIPCNLLSHCSLRTLESSSSLWDSSFLEDPSSSEQVFRFNEQLDLKRQNKN